MGAFASHPDSRCWQLNESIGLHAQKCHAACHVLEVPVGLGLTPQLTQLAGDRSALKLWILSDEIANSLEIERAEFAGAVNAHELFNPF